RFVSEWSPRSAGRSGSKSQTWGARVSSSSCPRPPKVLRLLRSRNPLPVHPQREQPDQSQRQAEGAQPPVGAEFPEPAGPEEIPTHQVEQARGESQRDDFGPA